MRTFFTAGRTAPRRSMLTVAVLDERAMPALLTNGLLCDTPKLEATSETIAHVQPMCTGSGTTAQLNLSLGKERWACGQRIVDPLLTTYLNRQEIVQVHADGERLAVEVLDEPLVAVNDEASLVSVELAEEALVGVEISEEGELLDLEVLETNEAIVQLDVGDCSWLTVTNEGQIALANGELPYDAYPSFKPLANVVQNVLNSDWTDEAPTLDILSNVLTDDLCTGGLLQGLFAC